MSNQNPRFSDFIKVYWSITWRANTFGTMIIIILFCFCPFLLHLLINFGKLEAFREHLFSVLPISSSAEKIRPYSSGITLYFSLWSFIWDYLIFWYGFRRILQQKIFQDLLINTPSYASYNKVFLVPLLLYYSIELLLSSYMDNNSGSQITLTTFTFIIYFITVFVLLKRVIKRHNNETYKVNINPT